ncbi:MAG: DnaJ domain-containing protein [Candidatus Melainabacteria bacterium]|nr:DnaJ domain-containing protein [Candidatus Melainabacteria bacterium]
MTCQWTSPSYGGNKSWYLLSEATARSSPKRTGKLMESKPAFKDYYYILGVSPDATGEEIQEAYHDLYEKYGPHVSIGGQDPDMLLKTFKDLSEAYEILMDPAKRKRYDEANKQHIYKGDLRRLWGKLSGAPAVDETQQKKKPTVDTLIEIEVTLREAVKGTKKHIRLEEPKSCADCVGLKPVQRMQCPNCRGLGYTSSERTEEVELPAGLYDKLEVRKSALGKYDLQAGRNGDLVITIRLAPHPYLGVLGRDITCTVPITIYEAVLGGEIEVPTATGRVIMKVQPRTQAGRVYRLKGLGLAGADQLVTVEVVTPQQLGNEEVSLYQKLKGMSKDPNPRESLYTKL